MPLASRPVFTSDAAVTHLALELDERRHPDAVIVDAEPRTLCSPTSYDWLGGEVRVACKTALLCYDASMGCAIQQRETGARRRAGGVRLAIARAHDAAERLRVSPRPEGGGEHYWQVHGVDRALYSILWAERREAPRKDTVHVRREKI
jgi:hypothetical protein